MHFSVVDDNSHKTAITRRGLSAPARTIQGRGLLRGRCLDYGCGKGGDAALLDVEKYDPYFYPEQPINRFDTILCTYVLNVISPRRQKDLLSDISRLLKKNGRAYIAVRRDFKESHISSRGTLQRVVKLKMPVVIENSNFCIYEMTKL